MYSKGILLGEIEEIENWRNPIHTSNDRFLAPGAFYIYSFFTIGNRGA